MSAALADRLALAAAEAALLGRALPLAPVDLARARLDLWATAKAAERFLEARTGDQGAGGFKPLIGARYRKGLRGRWSAALVPLEGGQAALEAIVGPVVAYQALAAEQAPSAAQPPAETCSAAVVPLTVQRARLADLAQRLEVVRPRRSWGERLIDWQACHDAARAAANLPGAEWQAWRDQARLVAG